MNPTVAGSQAPRLTSTNPTKPMKRAERGTSVASSKAPLVSTTAGSLPVLAIVGATGSLGRVITERALARGHRVLAVSRNPGRVGMEHPRLELRSADVTDVEACAAALNGAGAVLVALGASPLDGGGIRARGTQQVIRGMGVAKVRRLVCLSILGAGGSYANLPWGYKAFVYPLVLRRPYRDHARQEAHVRASDLDWVLVRPPSFTDEPARGDYRHGFGDDAEGLTLRISREDLADFMLDQATDDRYLRQSPGISY